MAAFQYLLASMKFTLSTLFILVLSSNCQAQFVKEKYIQASIGLGITITNNTEDVRGQGFYMEGEYVLKTSSWFELRPYAGFIYTDTYEDELTPAQSGFEIKSSAFFTGGKARLIAPIPWLAPYLEFGIGLSAGTFENRTFAYDFKKTGVYYHIPFSIGVLLGPERNLDVAFKYLYHPDISQTFGAAAIGVSIPID